MRGADAAPRVTGIKLEFETDRNAPKIERKKNLIPYTQVNQNCLKFEP